MKTTQQPMSESDKFFKRVKKTSREGFILFIGIIFWLPVLLICLVGSIATGSAGFAAIILILAAGIYLGIHKTIKKVFAKSDIE